MKSVITDASKDVSCCRKCGTKLSLEGSFCHKCGTKILYNAPAEEKTRKKTVEANNKKYKSLFKDIAITLSILGPLLFCMIGGMLWINDAFDGTIMEQLFPAMFIGFILAFAVVIVASNLFKNFTIIWIIGAIITFISVVVLYLLELTFALGVLAVVIAVTVLLMSLIKIIVGIFERFLK